ncbi:MAG: hypothetical protein P4L38_12410 [Syntrophaceae bacterium]|nr:hypothetical protein [Syntrophaceae bacterium]
MDAFPVFFIFLITVFVIVLIILWTMLPFILLGTNKRLDTIIQLLQPPKTAVSGDNPLETEVIKLLEEMNYFSAQETAKKNLHITEREFSDLYQKLKKEGKVKWKMT